MNKKTKKLARATKKVAGKMANIACGSASIWGGYQPKEPTFRPDQSTKVK